MRLVTRSAAGAVKRIVKVARRTIDLQHRVHALEQMVQGLRDQLSQLQARVGPIEGLWERLNQLHRCVEPIHFRPQTDDECIWRMVTNGEYRLPPRFEATDVIIDVGAHIGSFSHTCLVRGAGRVFSFEPESSNHALAAANLARFGSRDQLYNLAVWRSDGVNRQLFHKRHGPDSANTGCWCVATDEGQSISWVAFDQFLEEARESFGVRRVRLLKLDCEGSEYAILLTSKRLSMIEEICGEYHNLGHAPEHLSGLGASKLEGPTIKDHLEQHGFMVELEPITESSGHFFAKRSTSVRASSSQDAGNS
jgi:FkbM family methyltransferase